MLESSVTLEEKSSTGFALAAGGGQVMLAWTGSDYRLNTMWSTDGRTFGDKQTLRHRSSKTTYSGTSGPNGSSTTKTEPLAPALAVLPGGRRFLAWTGTNGSVNVMAADADAGAGHAVLSQRSAHPPALAAWGNELAFAWTGTDRHINVSWTEGGTVVERAQTLDQTSGHGPALAPIGGEMALAWTGSDRRINVLVSQGGGFGTPWVLDQRSSDAPALGTVGDRLILAWTGTDHQVNLTALSPGHAGAPLHLPATTRSSPTLCTVGSSHVLLGWTGSDRRLNLATLAAPT
jgi:hypothetical protein